MKYVCTFLASFRSSTHLMFRSTARHSWFIFAMFKRVKASSRFNLFCVRLSRYGEWFMVNAANPAVFSEYAGQMWNKPSRKWQSIVAFAYALPPPYRHGAVGTESAPPRTFSPIYWPHPSSCPSRPVEFVENSSKIPSNVSSTSPACQSALDRLHRINTQLQCTSLP